MVDRLLLSSPFATLWLHQDLEQESQRRVREVETLEQQLSKAAMDTCLDKWICKDRNRGTWHFWSLKPRSLRDVYNILQLFISVVMVHCDSMHLGILRLYLEWLGHLATYGRAFPKSWQINGNEGFCGAPCMSAHLGFGPRAAAQRKGGRGTSISALPNGRSGLAARPQPPEVARYFYYLMIFVLDTWHHLTQNNFHVPEEEGLRDAFI